MYTHLYYLYCSSAVEPNTTFHMEYNAHPPKCLLLGIFNKQILGVNTSQINLILISVMKLPS